jgi:hypothetical protein
MNKIARVFPVRTAATPDDQLSFVDCEPGLFPPEVDEVHISVAFSWLKRRAEELAYAWESVAPVKIGGPGWSDDPGADFVPGLYLKRGYVITSRGCPNKCWFCSVWKRESGLRELPITEGWIVQDDNLLACSERHIRAVFEMLSKQRRAHLRGLEARLLQPWHIDLLCRIKPAAMWIAYDTPDDYEPLVAAGRMLWQAGFTHSRLYCYVLVGHPRDTIPGAELRLRQAWRAGFVPFAMLWRNLDGERDSGWMRFSRSWCRPASIKVQCAQEIIEALTTAPNSRVTFARPIAEAATS